MPLYRHPADHQPQFYFWSPTVKHIKEILEAKLKVELNHALIQLYRNGEDAISEHSDKTLDIKEGSYIINASFGATRTMVLKHKVTRDKMRIRLSNNTALIMSLITNANWLHSIPQDKRPNKTKSKDELSLEKE